MSHSFARFIALFPYNILKLTPREKAFILSGALAVHCSYANATYDRKQITVEKKYKFNRNGFTEFMVVDEEGNHYNVNNSLWFWKWDSIEDWSNIQEKRTYMVNLYGFRKPLFGMFPNIVSSHRLGKD